MAGPGGSASTAGCTTEAYCREMGPTRRMQQVEVVDDDRLVAAADPPRTAGHGRRWGAVLLVVTLVLVGAQLLLAARDRAATARLAQLPGVLPPVEADVGVLWRVADADQAVLTEGAQIAGLLVGVRTGADGTQSAVALDPRTGADRWTVPLSGADPVLAQRGARGVGDVLRAAARHRGGGRGPPRRVPGDRRGAERRRSWTGDPVAAAPDVPGRRGRRRGRPGRRGPVGAARDRVRGAARARRGRLTRARRARRGHGAGPAHRGGPVAPHLRTAGSEPGR